MTTQGHLKRFVPYLIFKGKEKMFIDKGSARDRNFLLNGEV
jgi:hypothetical protein